jgi:hypothetical protein
MAAATTPETVLGVPFFIPSANNFFSVSAGGLPNGDDCLNVLGATNNDVLAVQRAPITGDQAIPIGGAPLTSAADDFSLTFWLKATDPGTPTGKLISCKDWGGTYATGSLGGGGSALDRWWIVCSESGGALRLGYNRRQSRDGIHARNLDSITYDTWHLCTFTVGWDTTTPAVNRLNMGSFLDDTAGTLGVVAPSGAFGAGLQGYPHLAIGGYVSGFDGPNFNCEIGKLQFWDHALTLTERQSLYSAMIDPC